MTDARTSTKNVKILQQIAGAVGPRFELDPVLKVAVQELGDYLQCSRCFVNQFDEKGVMTVTQQYTAEGILPLGQDTVIVMPGVYHSQQTVSTVKSEDALEDPRFKDTMEIKVLKDLQVQSLLATPISFKGSVLGFLGIQQCNKVRRWSEDEVELVEAVAAQLSIIMRSFNNFAEQESLTDSLARMNQDLSQLYVQLRAKDEQIGKFMHLISHDLRSPIIAIKGVIELLKKEYENDPVDSKPRRYLDLIVKSAEQVTALTTALLDYSRIGRSDLKLEMVNTEELVTELWNRLAIGEDNASLELFSALPVVRADKIRLSRAFQNLLENSLKYRQEEGECKVDVSWQDTEDSWQFAVNDNGIGFHPSQSEELFDIFTRLNDDHHKPGSGIGLASVLEIARLHGGKAWATGRPGKGSTFYFTISKKINETAS